MNEGSRNAYSMSRLVSIAIGVALSAWVLVTAKSAFYPFSCRVGSGLFDHAIGV